MKPPFCGLTALFVGIAMLAHAQEYLPNPSMEGPSRANFPPEPWMNCGPGSSADTQPGQLGITKIAADNLTCIGMVARGDDQFVPPQAGSTEGVGAFLLDTLLAGEAYDLTFSLSYDPGFIWEGIDFGNPCRLRIFIADGECNKKQEVHLSQPIGHYPWREYTFRFTASARADFLIFETAFADESDRQSCNLFLDAGRLRKSYETEPVEPMDTVNVQPDTLCQAYLPNAFSPNDDGRNDTFRAYLACEPSRLRLSIFSHWGGKVFEGASPSQGWDGRIRGEPAPGGLYTFVLEYEFGEGLKVKEYGQVSLLR
ncbi:MAG: gliding motility-associated C-terminal domain-containing protein [Phaeodactylibacter sp.]|nr:gliding motility-associated C-terminal domain-containing protein [Phaeodactylibacter sp.]